MTENDFIKLWLVGALVLWLVGVVIIYLAGRKDER